MNVFVLPWMAACAAMTVVAPFACRSAGKSAPRHKLLFVKSMGTISVMAAQAAIHGTNRLNHARVGPQSTRHKIFRPCYATRYPVMAANPQLCG